MAVESKQQPEFGYKNIEILKGEGNSLGIGSYGAVYKACCDDLPCAAKILHPTLFQSNDPGARRLLQRFEQECSFMNRIRHPNIVLYLGVCRDPQSGLPALLMELLEENLTTFLERSQEPLPFHVQVNLCYDVALALSYLHSNNIVHTDLTSNNVLMVVGHRIAKVTDFGMSKLIASSGISKRFSMVSLTHCPGTEVYMPPEAFRGSPEYTDKLDCFLFGSLVIQIITRLFPDPGERTRVIPFPDSPTGTTEVPILETERRQSHIKLIDSDHPLLSIAVSCISYKPEERPSTQEICGKIVAIRDSAQYTTSRRDHVGIPPARVGMEGLPMQKLPRTISATNLETATRCRRSGLGYGATFTLPTLDNYPPEFKKMVFDHLTDKETQQLLEREHTLNWCKSTAVLVPLRTRDDGNSLCHAASLAMWGLHDCELNLRRGISQSLSYSLRVETSTHYNNYSEHPIKQVERRFKTTVTYTYKHQANNTGETGTQPDPRNSGDEWKRLVEIASAEPSSGIHCLENLEEFHIFYLAHHLMRPIIVYANCNDAKLLNIKYHGIYLPLHQNSSICSKNPLPLSYHGRGHFSALVCLDPTCFYFKANGYSCIPICDYYGRMFPVKYLLANENSSSLIETYLDIIRVNVPNVEKESPYFNTTTVTCAKKIEDLKPSGNVKALVTEFVDTCHIEYIREQQEQLTNK